MNTRSILLAALTAACAAPALADEANEPVRVEKREFAFAVNGAAPMRFNLDGAEIGLMRSAKSIKNAPYTAEIITENVQVLADGNQIVNKNSQLSYRDSQGRLRQEVRDAKGEVSVITIHDADGVIWTLNPRSKTATKLAVREFGRGVAEMAKARVEALRKDGKTITVESGNGGEQVIVKRVERADGDNAQKIQENVQIRVAQQFRDGKAPTGEDWGSHIATIMGSAFGDAKWSRKTSSKDLGSKEIDGVKAEGKLRSYEIPAGEVGNKNAIVVSDETWFSPELQITVYSKHSDPRSGDRIYRVASLKREEPKAELFNVPADYKVSDALARVRQIEKVEKKN
ncbi:hypothetical protein [Massilia sp. TS11]|uniref:hypothetical protein n=1 Tax=Massilia sp. TS11 TaxID=2908003 RepID=UPI001EDC4C0B|nr:hypothetical protein [Massilia sp. TS11]MCG2585046.1 hypothetical protein [Massilia sp. TS11]